MKELRITPIKNGTVIDHIKPGMAVKVMELLGIGEGNTNAVSIAMFAHSKKLGRKDIVKVEEMELRAQTVNRLAVLTPNATISIIRDFKVIEKFQVELPKMVEGIVKCENINCITNQREPVEPKLIRTSEDPPVYRCYYCGRDQEELIKHLV